MLKWTLIPLGLTTAVVLAAPQLVIVGLVFLILPGLILALVPTVFAYLSTTCLVRACLPKQSVVVAPLTAFGLTLGVSAVLMSPFRAGELRKFEEAAIPDIVPQERLKIEGDILLDWPQPLLAPHDEVVCHSLCTALLDTPGVTSVTQTGTAGAATFRRGPNHPGSLVMPFEPQEILEKFAKMNPEAGRQTFEAKRQTERALQAQWALRIAQGEEFRKDKAIDAKEVDWTIRLVSRRDPGQPQIDRLEVLDRDGTVKVRKSLVKPFVPARMFYLGFEGGTSADGFRGARFHVGGSTVLNHPGQRDFDGAVELLQSVDIPEPATPGNIINQMQVTLQTVLDDPRATETQLLIVPMWLKQFRYDAKAGQIPTIARILNDDRIADPGELLRTALASGTDLTPLREGLVKRFRSATESQAKSWYITSLVGLPSGTFAQPTEEERALWKDAVSSPDAAPFVERMADLGPSALPELQTVLDETLTKPWHARWRVIDGVREAYKRLGVDALPAASHILMLIEKSPSSLLNTSGDRKEWLIALRLMGVPIEELPFLTRPGQTAQLASEKHRIEQQVQRYRQEKKARR